MRCLRRTHNYIIILQIFVQTNPFSAVNLNIVMNGCIITFNSKNFRIYYHENVLDI